MLDTWFPEHGAEIFEQLLIYYERHAHKIVPYPGVYEMVSTLNRQGYVLGIVSSKKRIYILKELEASRLSPFFSVVVAQDDTAEHKPSPVPLFMAAQHLGIEPECCMYVGDQPTDIQAAHAAGMMSVASYWGEGKHERVSPLEPNYSLRGR